MDFEWNDEADGQFVNLHALAAYRDDIGPEGRLPDWDTIQAELPGLIHPSRQPGDRYFISHRWDDLDHPDPSGWQFDALRQLAAHYHYGRRNAAVWYDFMSLPQRRPRGGHRGRIFSAGLKNIRRTVGRCQVVCLVSQDDDDQAGALKAMLRRGWIVFELYIARSQMKRAVPLYQRQPAMVDFGRQQYEWDAVVPDMHAHAPTDTPELIHQWLQNRDIVCTNGSDLKMLAGLLHEELNTHDRVRPVSAPPLNRKLILSNEEMQSYALLNANGRSLRFPELFMDPNHKYDQKRDQWAVMFRRRPPLPPLGEGLIIDADRIGEWLIDAKTGISPMYPGICFQITASGAVSGFRVN